jgi:hypothetical protein
MAHKLWEASCHFLKMAIENTNASEHDSDIERAAAAQGSIFCLYEYAIASVFPKDAFTFILTDFANLFYISVT